MKTKYLFAYDKLFTTGSIKTNFTSREDNILPFRLIFK